MYPIEIKRPRDTVRKLLPLMYLSISAVSLANGAAGLARMFGVPAPMVPKSVKAKAGKLVKDLSKDNSLQEFDCLQSCLADANDASTVTLNPQPSTLSS